MKRVRRIFHPLDFSRASGAAFTVARVPAKGVLGMGVGHVSPKVYADLQASTRAYDQKRAAKAGKACRRAP